MFATSPCGENSPADDPTLYIYNTWKIVFSVRKLSPLYYYIDLVYR